MNLNLLIVKCLIEVRGAIGLQDSNGSMIETKRSTTPHIAKQIAPICQIVEYSV